MLDDRSPKDGVSVNCLSVEELYSSPFTFNLPWYQRAYAWTETQALRLLVDINSAYRSGARRYFIGHVLLTRSRDEARHILVDGQQRAVTLIILFAILRAKIRRRDVKRSGAWTARLTSLIEAEGDGRAPDYRLLPQPALQAFFTDHIQVPDAFEKPVDVADASAAERNVMANRVCLEAKLDELLGKGFDLTGFAEFLLTRCVLVVEVIDEDYDNEAWEILQTEENTGLAFHDGARIKVTLIEAMPAADRDEASRLWEQYQAQLGDDGMQELVGHMRDLSGRQRSRQPVEKDILARFKVNTDGVAFMRGSLVPAAERLLSLRHREIGTEPARAGIARFLKHLDLTGTRFWRTAVLQWLETRGGGDAETTEFFRLLARKAWLLRIAGVDSVEHERRFIALGSEIREGQMLDRTSELAVPAKLIERVRDGLDSRTFDQKGFCRPVLHYLDDLIGGPAPTRSHAGVKIEHICPRNPLAGSDWSRTIRDTKQFAHRLGNLALLTFAENQEIGNKEYAEKRDVLGASEFALTRAAAAADDWNGEHILARSDALIGRLFAHWGLQSEIVSGP